MKDERIAKIIAATVRVLIASGSYEACLQAYLMAQTLCASCGAGKERAAG